MGRKRIMPHRVYIGVGSNLGIPEANCRRAMNLLHAPPVMRVVRRSRLYKTRPVGNINQGWFVNAAVELSTSLSPAMLLGRLLAIERRLGRVRRARWGPRLIDLDLLFYDRLTMKTAALEIPHPHAAGRRFVLAPLFEIAPAYRHPRLNQSIAELLARAPGSQADVLPFSPGSSRS